MKNNTFVLCGFIFVLAASTICFAGEVDVLEVKAEKAGDRTYSFTVTVKHDDEGWDHYANQWEVLGPDGNVIGTRVLYHPHIGERQFTRKLRGVTIPEGVEHVIVRVHDKLHGYSREKLIALPTGKSRDTGFK